MSTAYAKGHRFFDPVVGVWIQRPSWLTRAETRPVAKAIRKITGRTYFAFHCSACGAWHIRMAHLRETKRAAA